MLTTLMSQADIVKEIEITGKPLRVSWKKVDQHLLARCRVMVKLGVLRAKEYLGWTLFILREVP